MGKTLHTLIIDDNPFDRALAIRELGREFPHLQAQEITAPETLEQALQAGDLDLVITDYHLGWTDGLQILRAVKARCPDCPVIMFTGTGSEEIAVAAMKAGLDDYVLKSVQHYARLPAAVRSALDKTRKAQALEQAKARYRTLFEGVPIGLYRTTPQGQFIEANPALVHMLGYPDQPALLDLKLKMSDLYVNAARYAQRQATLEQSGALQNFYAQLRRRDGSVIAISDKVNLVRDVDGAVQYLDGSLEDVTEQEKAQATLQQRNQELALLNRSGQAFNSTLDLNRVLVIVLEEVRHLLDVVASSIWLSDPETDELVCQQATGPNSHVVRGWRLPLGQGVVGWVAQNNVSLIVPDLHQDPRHFKGVDQQTGLALRAILSVPLQVKQKVIGVLQVVDAQVDRFHEADLALIEPLATEAAIAIENARLFEQAQQEITRRVQAEAALKRRNEDLIALNVIATTLSQPYDLPQALRAILDQILQALDVEAGWIQLCQETSKKTPLALVAYRGLARATAQAKPILQLARDLLGRVTPGEASITVTQDTHAAPLDLKTPRGETLHTWAGFPLQSQEQTLGALYVARRAARALDPQETQLLTAIGNQLSVALENRRLTEKAAEIEILHELNRLRSQLVANVSHELRTPLGLIKVFCTTLLREDIAFDDETRQEFLHDIEKETERLEQIVENLLDTSRMREGQLRLHKEPTDVTQLLRSLVSATQFQRIPHHLTLDLPAHPLIAHIDRKRVEQVLLNLLSNAIKYSPGGGSITVQGRGDPSQILIWIRDKGLGIPTQDLERVFERFYRIESEATQSISGVGLGLAVCRGIVEAHGGQIWVESKLGQGSTFYFTLPTGDTNSDAAHLNAVPSASSPAPPTAADDKSLIDPHSPPTRARQEL